MGLSVKVTENVLPANIIAFMDIFRMRLYSVRFNLPIRLYLLIGLILKCSEDFLMVESSLQ